MLTENVRDKILLVHSQEKPCDYIIKAISDSGYETILADSLFTAREKILNANFKFVLADKELADGNGFDVLNCVRQVGSVPFILLSERSDSKDSEGAQLLNFAYLSKPFKGQDLIETFDRLVEDLREELALNGAQHVNIDEQFSVIDIGEFITGKEIRYDIFINIGKSKYVKLSHGCDSLTYDQIEKLKMRGVTSLCMKKADFLEYMSMTINLIKGMPKFKMSSARKTSYIHQTTKILMDSVLLEELNWESLAHAKAVVESTLGVLCSHHEILTTLEMLKNNRKSVHQHSLNVALFSVMIARHLNWNSYPTLSKLAAGGMFHDIGKIKIPSALLQIEEKDLTDVERLLVEEHVGLGVGIMRRIHEIPEEVLMIVEQHHEDDSGLGYPRGIKRSLIHPLSRIVKLADDFCELMTDRPANMANLMEAIAILEVDMINKYHSGSVAALKSCFKKGKLNVA